MNLNDMRANAYMTQQNLQKKNGDEKTEKSGQVEKQKTVKPFVPAAFIKSSELAQTQEKIAPSFIKTTATEEKKPEPVSFKAFEPISLATSSESAKKQKIDYSKNELNAATNALKSGGLLKVPVEKPEIEGKDSVYRRVAKFLLLLGESEAAKILPHLTDKQIEKIIPEIASIRSVDSEEAAVIFEEFNQLLENARHSGGVETAREMLEKAYGADRANAMMAKAMPVQNKKPFEYLNDEENEKIYLLLKDENVGVKSLVLSHLEPQKAAAVINSMSTEDKKEVVMRLAKMEPMSPDIINRIDRAMKEKNRNQKTEKAEVIDGRNALAQILKKMDSGAENEILESLSEGDPDLGQDLRSRLFTIDDVINSDDRFIQNKLHDMKESDIAYLIAGKSNEFRDKILYNISTGRREEVLTQEDILKPMRRSDVETVTKNFIAQLRQAYENGDLIIKNRNDDVFVN